MTARRTATVHPTQAAHPTQVWRLPLIALALLTLLAAADTRAAPLVFSDFTADAEGWTGISCTNPGLCAPASPVLAVQHLDAGGNPEGYVRTIDPGEDNAARLVAPAAFMSALATGLTLSFDVRVESNGGGGVFDPNADFAPLVTIETSGLGTLVYALPKALFPTIDGDWAHYDVVFDGTDPAWLLFTGALNTITPAQFETAFAARTRLSLIGEWLKEGGEVDSGGIDNVALTAVPLPAPLALLAPALAWLSRTRRRVSTRP